MSLIWGLFSSVTSDAGMELSDETSFVSRRWGTILLLFQTLSALSWTSLHQSSSVTWEHVRHSGSPQSGARWEMKGQRREIFKKSEICGNYIYNVGLPAFLFSVLKVLWKGLTDEGGSMSNTREEAQLWMRLQHQTSPGTNLQHNTLQPTSLRSVHVSTKLWSSVFWSPCQPLSFCLLTDENCRDVRQQCELVVQARLCVYTYYKKVCCASCVQSAQRAKRHWPANGRHPLCASSGGLGQKG